VAAPRRRQPPWFCRRARSSPTSTSRALSMGPSRDYASPCRRAQNYRANRTRAVRLAVPLTPLDGVSAPARLASMESAHTGVKRHLPRMAFRDILAQRAVYLRPSRGSTTTTSRSSARGGDSRTATASAPNSFRSRHWGGSGVSRPPAGTVGFPGKTGNPHKLLYQFFRGREWDEGGRARRATTS